MTHLWTNQNLHCQTSEGKIVKVNSTLSEEDVAREEYPSSLEVLPYDQESNSPGGKLVLLQHSFSDRPDRDDHESLP